MDKHYLTALFEPESVIVFASRADDPTAQTPHAQALLNALRAQEFKGALHFWDIHTGGTLADLVQTRADLAIIALPAEDIASALELAARVACRAALLISSGITAAMAQELKRIAHKEGIHLLGPNSLGFQRPQVQLNAMTGARLAQRGSLALVSQSGAVASSMLDWASSNGVGFSLLVSLGPHTVVEIAEVLDFLANDAQTHSIVVYLEGISSARRFMSALRSAARSKPVIVLKAGRKLLANRAAQTHSGANVGSDDVFDAALRRAGAVRVRSLEEFFSASKCLASRSRTVGKKLAIITNGGGPGVLAVDWMQEIALQPGHLSPESVAELKPLLSPLASLHDLLDLSEHAQPEHFRKAIAVAENDRQIDGVLVIYSPKSSVDAQAIADTLTDLKRATNKPLLVCWMGDTSVSVGREIFKQTGIPSFRTPEVAVAAFGCLAAFYENQLLLQQTPHPLSTLKAPDVEGARLVIEGVLAERRKVLTEMESKTLLSAFHIPVTKTMLARTANEAMMIATQLGFPVALKIDSPDISHKSDVQGVVLNIENATGVRDVYNDMVQAVKKLQPQAHIHGVTVQNMAAAKRGREIFIGVLTDDPFGPVIVFGAGGTMVDLINDRAMELPPLNQFLARRLIERSRVSQTLGEWRGSGCVNMDMLEHVLLRVSEMVCELPQLREMDINPLIVDENGAVAVDARIVIDHAPQTASGISNNYSHLAILPYPARYTQVWPLPGGGEYSVRPIRPDDGQMLQDMVHKLSPESRYFRFVSSISELPPTMLARFTLIDYDREMALVAVFKERVAVENGEFSETERIIGVSRYVTNPDQFSCEFALVVAEDFKGKGLGARLMLSIMDVAREKGLTEMNGLVLANNPTMLKLMRRLGFSSKTYAEDHSFKLVTHML